MLAVTQLIGFGGRASVPLNVYGRNTATTDPASTSHTVNLPAGIQAGDLLIAFLSTRSITSHTWPGDWTKLGQTNNTEGVSWAWKVATGSEGASITVTGGSAKSAAISYLIRGYQGVPEMGVAATGSSTSPDPPSLTPSFGSGKTLWLATEGSAGNPTASGFPTNYTNGRTVATSGGTDAHMASAERILDAASDDPGVFTITVSNSWVAQTIAVKSG